MPIRELMEITLKVKVSISAAGQPETVYKWVGNDGYVYSPELSSKDESLSWPQTNGLRRLEIHNANPR